MDRKIMVNGGSDTKGGDCKEVGNAAVRKIDATHDFREMLARNAEQRKREFADEKCQKSAGGAAEDSRDVRKWKALIEIAEREFFSRSELVTGFLDRPNPLNEQNEAIGLFISSVETNVRCCGLRLYSAADRLLANEGMMKVWAAAIKQTDPLKYAKYLGTIASSNIFLDHRALPEMLNACRRHCERERFDLRYTGSPRKGRFREVALSLAKESGHITEDAMKKFVELAYKETGSRELSEPGVIPERVEAEGAGGTV